MKLLDLLLSQQGNDEKKYIFYESPGTLFNETLNYHDKYLYVYLSSEKLENRSD